MKKLVININYIVIILSFASCLNKTDKVLEEAQSKELFDLIYTNEEDQDIRSANYFVELSNAYYNYVTKYKIPINPSIGWHVFNVNEATEANDKPLDYDNRFIAALNIIRNDLSTDKAFIIPNKHKDFLYIQLSLKNDPEGIIAPIISSYQQTGCNIIATILYHPVKALLMSRIHLSFDEFSDYYQEMCKILLQKIDPVTMANLEACDKYSGYLMLFDSDIDIKERYNFYKSRMEE